MKTEIGNIRGPKGEDGRDGIDGGSDAETALRVQSGPLTRAALVSVVADLLGPALTADPDDSGTFIIRNPAALTEDPDDPGTFLNGASA